MSDATRVAIVGLGAIGGSAALKLIQRGVSPRGFSDSLTDRQLAAKAGVRVDESIEQAVAAVDLVLIAVPLDAVADVARQVLTAAPPTATVLHASSLQRPAALGLGADLAERVIGTHPLAGTPHTGFAAARPDMYHESVVYVEPRGTSRYREDAELFWSMAGAARIIFLDADDHDDRMAAVSHLPQLVSTALAATLARAGIAATALGPGGRDMTRLAESSWSMWAPLLAGTPARTAELLGQVAADLVSMRQALIAGEPATIEMTWKAARDWRAQVG